MVPRPLPTGSRPFMVTSYTRVEASRRSRRCGNRVATLGHPAPDAHLDVLVGAMVFAVLIGNADAHGNNLSLLLDPPGAVRLAPLYDTVSTVLFPKLTVRCAMWVGGVRRSFKGITWTELLREIAGRHAWKVPEDDARALIDRSIHAIAAHADETPTGHDIAIRAQQLLDATPWPGAATAAASSTAISRDIAREAADDRPVDPGCARGRRVRDRVNGCASWPVANRVLAPADGSCRVELGGARHDRSPAAVRRDLRGSWRPRGDASGMGVMDWLIDKSALVRVGTSADSVASAGRVNRVLVRISTVTPLEVGYSSASHPSR